MSDIEYTRQQTLDLIEELRRDKAEAQQLCADLRKQIWEIKRWLNDPTLDSGRRDELEDWMFEDMQMLKSQEEQILRNDESLADLRYTLERLDVAIDRDNTGIAIGGAVAIVVLLVFILYLFSG